jgi:hypothetical protein
MLELRDPKSKGIDGWCSEATPVGGILWRVVKYCNRKFCVMMTCTKKTP